VAVLRIEASQPFDWAPLHAFLRLRAIPGVEAIDGHRYRRSVAVDGAPGILEVGPSSEAALDVSVDGRAPTPDVERRLRRWFDLDADTVAIDAHLGRDPVLASFIEARPGLRVPGAWDPFELAVRAIVGQQISVVGARTIAGRIVERAGERIRATSGHVQALFPRPEQLAVADLDAIGMPGARVRSIVGLASAVANDPSILAPTGDLDADVARLRSLPGIGEWTAQYIALRGLKHPDAFPASDLGLLRAMADRAGRRPTAPELLARAEAWRPYRAYAAQHLWSATAGSRNAESGGLPLPATGPGSARSRTLGGSFVPQEAHPCRRTTYG
jgi:AraC family transcriptional regulator, regulatory protein of adaptative response / DNA-3-methyladenine glycosylase II